MGRAPADFWFIQGSDDRLRDLATAGYAPTQISRMLGVTRCSVVYRAARLGLTLQTNRQYVEREKAAKPEVVVYYRPSPPRRFSWQDEDQQRQTKTA